MKKNIVLTVIVFFTCFSVKAQTTKKTENVNQVWFTYINQLRLSNKWELTTDLNLRTLDGFVNDFSVSIVRFGLTYYLAPNTKLTAGYAWANFFPAGNHKYISQTEHRPWQQIQWITKYGNKTMRQGIRLEERFRSKILNDSTLAGGYNFNYRIRYALLYEIPLGKKENLAGAVSLILGDEVMVNFGEEVVYNYFDQNRFYAGFKLQTGKYTNLQLGYLNVFQQLPAGNKYLINNGIRLTCAQNFDLRKKK